jgi:hypothetical protein
VAVVPERPGRKPDVFEVFAVDRELDRRLESDRRSTFFKSLLEKEEIKTEIDCPPNGKSSVLIQYPLSNCVP